MTVGGLFVQPHEKRVILREIEFWRESRLLPKEYCDFLMNLYLGGEKTADELASASSLRMKPGNMEWRQILWIVGISLVLTGGILLLQHFSVMSLQTQVYLVAGAIATTVLSALLSRKPLQRFVFLAFFSILLVIEAYLLDRLWSWSWNQSNGLIPYMVAFCCWIAAGMLGHSRCLSSLGLIMLLLLADFRFLELKHWRTDYLTQHMFAFGLAMLTGILTRWLVVRGVKTSIAWLIGTVFALFLPEINQWLAGNPFPFLWEGILFFKVLLITSFGVVWRHNIYLWWKL
jgi:hypothetical protein